MTSRRLSRLVLVLAAIAAAIAMRPFAATGDNGPASPVPLTISRVASPGELVVLTTRPEVVGSRWVQHRNQADRSLAVFAALLVGLASMAAFVGSRRLVTGDRFGTLGGRRYSIALRAPPLLQLT